MTPKVSICIPAYNQGQYLVQAIRSALEQTLESLEVVVSDNQSTDETGAVLAGIRNERLRVVKPASHLGMAQNFDFCIASSRGEHVTILCSDDRLLPEYATLLAGALDRYPTAAMAYSAAVIVDEGRHTRDIERHVSGSFFRKGSDEIGRFLKGSGCVFPTMMMRRSCYDRAGGFFNAAEAGHEQASVIDWDIQLRLISFGDVAYVDEALAEYRVWSTEARQRRLLRLIEDTGRLYETRVKEMVVANPALRGEAVKGRRSRALTLACGLSELSTRTEFEEGARLILKVSDSAVVRCTLRLQSYGLSGAFSTAFLWWQRLRRVVKEGLSWRDGGRTHEESRIPQAPAPAGKTSPIQRVTHGVLANMLGQVINASGQVLLVPVFLAYWREQLYGEWLSLSAAVAYLSMLDFGMQMFLVNRMNQHYVRQEYKEHTRILHSALLFSLLLSATALALVIPLAVFMPLEKGFGFSRTPHGTAALVMVLLCMQVVGMIPHGLLSGCYRTIQEYARGQMVNNVRMLSTIALTVLVVAAGGGIVELAATQLAVLALSATWIFGDLRIRHKEIAVGLSAANLRLAISFLGPSSLFLLIQAAAAVTIQGSVLMVSALFGAASVAVFVPVRTLANLIRQATGALHSALCPEVTALESSRQYQALRNLHLMTSKALVLGSVCAAVFLHFTARNVILLWTHRESIFDARLMDAFLLLLVSQAPWLTSSLVLAASNNHRRLSICYFVSAVAGLGLGIIGAQHFGMPGIVYGIWLADILTCGWLVIRMACRLMHENVTHFLTEVVLRAAPCSIALFAIMSWIFAVLPEQAAVRLFTLAASTIAMGAVFGLIYFNQREKVQIRAGVAATFFGLQSLPSE
jgi:O-antigen/teichoic acid export membrane protein/GT2 family glycosyltransferase